MEIESFNEIMFYPIRFINHLLKHLIHLEQIVIYHDCFLIREIDHHHEIKI